MGSQVAQQGGRCRAIPDEGSRLPVRQDFALDQQLAVVRFQGGFEARRFKQASQWRACDLEDSGDASALGAATDHFGRRASAQQQPQGIDHDRLATARLARQQVQAGVKPDADLLDDGVILNDQLDQHSQ